MSTGEAIMAKIVALIINPIINLLFAVGFVMFIWGLVVFLWKSPDGGEGRNTGLQHMLWGAVGMFIMVATKGIIAIVLNTFGVPLP